MDYLLPTSDYVFKKIFGDPNNLYDILADFLKAVIPDLEKEELKEIVLRDTHLLPKIKDEKFGILDVMVELKSGKIIDIEIQVIDRKDMKERTYFYLSHLVSSQLASGDVYKNIKPVIAIIITKYKLIHDSENYHNSYKFYDEKNKSCFGRKMMIHTIELSKIKPSDEKTELYNWVKFFNSKSKEEFDMASKTSDAIYKAVKKVEELSLDSEARAEYEYREKALKDYNSLVAEVKFAKAEVKAAKAEAKAKVKAAKAEAKAAKAEGETNAKTELAVKLIKTGKMSLEEAIIFCGLDKKQSEEIKKLLN